MKGNKKNKIKVTSRAGRKEERTAYLCLIPAFLGVSLISYLPTLAVFVLSVFKWNGLSSPEFVGMDNFQRIFTKDIYFTDSIKATILYALLAVVGAIIYSLLVALLLNMKIWGRTLFRSVFFIPYLLPAIGVYKGWQWLYEGNFGLFNFVLRMVGLKPQRFLDSPSQVVPSLVVIAIWTSGNLIVVFLAGLQNVPRVYMEAAEIDGANAWPKFRYIMLPSIKSVIVLNMILSISGSLSAFEPPYVITGGTFGTATYFVMMNSLAHEKGKIGLAAAMAVVLMGLIFIVTIFQQVIMKLIDEEAREERRNRKIQKQLRKQGIK